MNRIVLLAILFALTGAACAHPTDCVIKRDRHGKIARSARAVKDFRSITPCPTTGTASATCPGYVVDHVRPLCDCGLDAPSNMRYQKYDESLLKDKWERQLCNGLGDN